MQTTTDEAIKVNCNTRTMQQIQQKTSILTHNQTQSETKYYFSGGVQYRIKVTIRYDDNCNNGHNSFGITGNIDYKKKNGQWGDYSGGCIHEEIAKHFPKLIPFIKWHLVDSTQPLHYIANAMYHAGHTEYKDAKNEDHLKSTIIYGALDIDSTLDWINMPKEKLQAHLSLRLPLLMKEFRKAMESLGFIY